MNDLISVIVPIYKVEKYLNTCIDSIINQTYKNLEIILVDDGSPDNCPKICDEYAKKDARIKVIHSENRGVSSARNIGLDNVSGKWVVFIDADDWVDENYIYLLLNQIDESVDIICCGYKRVNGNNIEKVNDDNKTIIYDNIKFIEKLLNVQNGYGFVHTKLIRKSLINNIRFDQNLKVSEDALFNMELARNTKQIKVINKAIYNYRITSESTVKKYDEGYVEKYYKAMQMCYDYIHNNFENNSEMILNINNFIVYHVMLIAVNYCYNPENPNKNKRKLLKDICKIELFNEAIKKSNYEDLSLSRKIMLFTLKNRLYLLASLICIIRQKQLRRK